MKYAQLVESIFITSFTTVSNSVWKITEVFQTITDENCLIEIRRARG